MSADPHGNGHSATDMGGRRRAVSERLSRFGDKLDALERAIPASRPKPPPRPPKVVRVRPFRSILIFIAIATLMILLAIFMVRSGTAHVDGVTYDPLSKYFTVWLKPDGGTPEHIHRHYQLSTQPGCRVVSFRQSPDGKDVYLELESGPDHAIKGDGAGFRTGSAPR